MKFISVLFHDIDNLFWTKWSLIGVNLIRTIYIENFISFSEHHSNMLYKWLTSIAELLLNFSSFLSFFTSFLF